MIITIDTSVALSPEDKALLALIAGSTHVSAEEYEAKVDISKSKIHTAAEKQAAEEKPAPRRRAAAKKTHHEPADEGDAVAPAGDQEPVDETSEAVEDDTPAVLEEEPAAADDAPTLEDAVAAATPLISAGKAAVVKKALRLAGVKRVGELAADSIAGFLENLTKTEDELDKLIEAKGL